MLVLIREETSNDVARIRHLLASAFPSDAEARLVDALRAAQYLTLSLCAIHEGELVGHIAFSPVVISSSHATHSGMGLGPMAVMPPQQRHGIGARLIAEGLERLRSTGHRFCVVLGHADYYPRHGSCAPAPSTSAGSSRFLTTYSSSES